MFAISIDTIAGCTIQYDEDYWISEGYTNDTCMKLCEKNTACQQWAWWGGACWLRNTKEQCTAKVKETMPYYAINTILTG